jgi:hypothetical protein
MTDSILEQRVREYAHSREIAIDFESPLGAGTDGCVWQTDRMTAVKALARRHNYNQELECYRRFKSAGVTQIGGFSVPELVDHSDELWIIEMGIVDAPFILDFAKVYLDRPPDYSPEVLAEDEEKNREIFEDRWPQVKSLLCELRRFGIWYMDSKPGNIMFEDWPERG